MAPNVKHCAPRGAYCCCYSATAVAAAATAVVLVAVAVMVANFGGDGDVGGASHFWCLFVYRGGNPGLYWSMLVPIHEMSPFLSEKTTPRFLREIFLLLPISLPVSTVWMHVEVCQEKHDLSCPRPVPRLLSCRPPRMVVFFCPDRASPSANESDDVVHPPAYPYCGIRRQSRTR